MSEAPTGPGHLGNQAKRLRRSLRGHADSRWLPKGLPAAPEPGTTPGQVGVPSSESGESRHPQPHTHPPTLVQRPGLTSARTRAAGAGSRPGWQVQGSLGCPGEDGPPVQRLERKGRKAGSCCSLITRPRCLQARAGSEHPGRHRGLVCRTWRS